MAAIAAARAGARVTVFERMPKPGAKLLATGGGRCNLTNTLETSAFLDRFGRAASRFMRPALAAMDRDDLLRFFAELGVRFQAEDGVHYFPVAGNASAVCDALRDALKRAGGEVVCRVQGWTLWIEEGQLKGLVQESTGATFPADRVILAAGGCAWPALGSDGSGFTLARQAGHAIARTAPALVPLVTQEEWPGQCAGVTFAGVRLRIDLPLRPPVERTGDLLFTHRGLSGPAALDLSGEVAALLQDRPSVPLRATLTGGVTAQEWTARLDAWRTSHGRKLLRSLVAESLPNSVAQRLCEQAGIPEDLRAAYIDRAQRAALAAILAETPFTIRATEGFERAMVTRGGVELKQVDPRTLASRLLPGLFFAGEILDIDGPCGGFNLQWAFSSGHLAGLTAARES
jgi:predicted Rossmann fold flavoprotein